MMTASKGSDVLRRDGTAVAFVSKAAEPNSQYRASMEDWERDCDDDDDLHTVWQCIMPWQKE